MQPTETSEGLAALRAGIDRCDEELVALLRRRMEISSRVAASKAGTGKPVRDPEREAAVVARVRALAGDAEALRADTGLPEHADGSLAGVRRVAFAGDAGSWSAVAARRLFPDAAPVASPSFAAACDLVSEGRADAAVLPLANTTGGPVDTVYHLLERNLRIVRSADLAVRHCLAAVPGAALAGVRTVSSHPQALAQCSRAIREGGWRAEPAENTAFAAAEATRRADPSFAAICSPAAAREHGLAILREDVCDTGVNATRFVAVSRELLVTPDASRLSLLLRLPDRPGALAATLDVFVDRALNLSSICSQPVPERPWEYAFFLDVEAPALAPAALSAVFQLSRELPFLRLLGWYGA